MKPVWLGALSRVAVYLALALGTGWLVGRPLLVATGALAALLGWHLVQLRRTTEWLQRGEGDEPPDALGLWGDMSAQLRGLLFRDRKRERRLKALLREYQETTAAMPDAAVVLNDSREILWFNEAARRYLGFDALRDVGQRIDNLIRQPDFVDYLAGGRYATPLELAAPTERKLRLVLHVVPYGAGQKLLLFRDNTRLHQLEKVRRKFVANASHELRTPLTVLAGYLDALADDRSIAEEWTAPLAEMQRQTARMNRIISDLLELSRLEASPAEVVEELFPIARVIDDVVSDALSQTSDAPALQVEVANPCRLRASESEIHSALANLVVNAVKYTPPDGQICVRWWADAEGGHFAVTDTGIGIAPKHIPRLTERFYRIDRGRSRRDGGTGLGLAIVKHVLQRHGAHLEVESQVGKGSRFTCHFPPDRIVRDAAEQSTTTPA